MCPEVIHKKYLHSKHGRRALIWQVSMMAILFAFSIWGELACLAKSEGEYFSYQSSKSIYTCSTLICTKMGFFLNYNIVCTIKSKKQFYKIISTSFKLACILTLVWTIENQSLFLYWAIRWWSTNWWNKKEWIFFNSFQQISHHNPLKKITKS